MTHYNLEDLLPDTAPLPYFNNGDVISFPAGDMPYPEKVALACSDLLRQDLHYEWIRTESTDEKSMRRRLFGKGLITGLRIVEITLNNKSEYPLLVDEKRRNAAGWMADMKIVHALPGFTEAIEATFPYAALVYSNKRSAIFRTGPYNPDTFQIGDIYHQELQDARRRSKAIGAGSMAVGKNSKKTTHSSLQDRAD
jgi:hypothetical protein